MSNSASSQSNPKFSLFETEEKVVERAEQLAGGFAEGAGNVLDIQMSFKELLFAYQQCCAEQRRLVRVGDRQQEQLRQISSEMKEKNRLLEEQASHLLVLNTELAHEIETRKTLELELRVLATTDPLTGLYNRRRFLELGDYEILREHRNQRGLSYLTLDIDHFKHVNDALGHAAGDEVLRRFALVCKTCLRAMDSIGRIGGEEFAILLPETGLPAACGVAEKIRAEVAACAMPGPKGPFQITVSIGAAVTLNGESFEQVMARADEYLYAAKGGGRNRVESSGPAPE